MATRLDHFIVEPITSNSLLFWDGRNDICNVGQFLNIKLQTVDEQSAVYQCVYKKSFPINATGSHEVLYYLVNIVEYDALFGVGRGGGGGGGEGTPTNITYLTSITQSGNAFLFNFQTSRVLTVQ